MGSDVAEAQIYELSDAEIDVLLEIYEVLQLGPCRRRRRGWGRRPGRSGDLALAGCAVFHGLICPATSMRLAPNAEGFSPAEGAPLAAVAEHIQGEHVLPDPGRGQDNVLRLLFDQRPSLARWAICSWKACSRAEVWSSSWPRRASSRPGRPR
jgi:hypothetical protein